MSDFWQDVSPAIEKARKNAKRNRAWASSRRMVNRETGEIISDKEGNPLTLADMTKSWYSKKGSRNNAFHVVERCKKAFSFECDLKRFRPKFISLTWRGDAADSWQAERAIQKFLDDLRHWLKRLGIKSYAYFWSAEVQMKNARGALHYHILVLGAPFISKKLLRTWWTHGFSDIQARDDLGRAFKYTAKYIWKWGKIWDELDIPEGDEIAALPEWWFLFSVFSKRRYGFSKWFTLPPIERMPRWLKESLQGLCALEDVQKANRAVGGGWDIVARSSVLDDGEIDMHFPSPFVIQEVGASSL
jgi:hypothetical protein